MAEEDGIDPRRNNNNIEEKSPTFMQQYRAWPRETGERSVLARTFSLGWITSQEIQKIGTLGFDRWVLVHFFTVFSFSFLMGIIIIHTSLLWHRYQSMSGSQENNKFLASLMAEYYGIDNGNVRTISVDMQANTSVYMS